MPVSESSLLILLLWAIIGYALGAIPFGLILTRAFGLGNLREIGSGNIGATNVLRTGNKPAAAATLVLDAAKGVAAVLLARALAGEDAAQVAALAAFLGHCFPVWLGFKGGKGVATFLGLLLGLACRCSGLCHLAGHRRDQPDFQPVGACRGRLVTADVPAGRTGPDFPADPAFDEPDNLAAPDKSCPPERRPGTPDRRVEGITRAPWRQGTSLYQGRRPFIMPLARGGVAKSGRLIPPPRAWAKPSRGAGNGRYTPGGTVRGNPDARVPLPRTHPRAPPLSPPCRATDRSR